MAVISQSWRNRIPQISRRMMVIIGVVIVVIVGAIVFRSLQSTAAATAIGATVTATQGDITASITATGKMTPRSSANLSYTSGGRVAAVLVVAGDTVAQHAPLVKLEDNMLSLDAQSATAALTLAQADVAVAAAQLAGAQAVLNQTVGSVTANDISAARAYLTEAQARLALLSNGTRADVLARTQAAVVDAQANLDTQRKTLAVAKAQADTLVAQRANDLADAQSAMTGASEDNQHVIDKGTDPRTGRELSQSDIRDYAGKYNAAVRANENATALLAQATRDADAARQAEISGIATAESRVNTAQADLAALSSGAGADVAAAKAAVATAESNLGKLLGDQRNAQVAAQEANVAAASAGLDRANARLTQAQAQKQMAGVNLDDATLTAPFAGVVADVSAKVGELVSTAPVVNLIDITKFAVEITVDEVDVAHVAVGQKVDVLVDALGAPALQGLVVRVAPQATINNGVVSYKVTVEATPDQRVVKSGMTASAQIITAQAKNAIGLPRAAVHLVDGVQKVTVIKNGVREVRTVETGVRGDDLVEIKSGVAVGDVVEIDGEASK
ncbi:MAG: efflux RND transporter periplasmic adaptor subunit [Chloroflexales bacterium]|nr:efflux RND transporter periplasmic adaptor subunit [Chloroflexales bacterium]